MQIVDDFNSILNAFKIKAQCINHRRIRNISLYDVRPSVGTKIKDITQYLDEISIALKAYSRPLMKIIPQDGIVQMEVVDALPETISFMENFTKLPKQEGILPLYIGNSISGQDIVFDLTKNPHTLIAGTTGSGKSVLLHTIIGNLAAYEDVETYLVDPKNIEFARYNDLKRIKVYNTFEQTVQCIATLKNMMEARYAVILEKRLPVNFFLSDQKDYPKIVLIIDEFADLIMQDSGKKLHKLICQLAQKSRAAGIFCIIATQRPSVSVINGEIKANFSARISCRTSSMQDSRVVLDCNGAEQLAGNGDAIIHNYKYNYQRFQAAYTTPEEISSIYKD